MKEYDGPNRICSVSSCKNHLFFKVNGKPWPATFVRAIGHCDTATEVGSHHEENDDEAMMLENDKRKIKKTSSFIHEKSASAFCYQP